LDKIIVDSKGMEFGYELIKIAPWAYYLYTQNKLEKVITCKDMKWFYYFTKCEEIYDKRIDGSALKHVGKIYEIHTKELDTSEWLPPPYYKFYQNNIFNFEKPLCIISNKYTTEWLLPPINFFNLEVLREMIEYLENKYTIIYNRQTFDIGTWDREEYLELNDFDLLQNYDDVILIQDLMKKYNMSYNELQIKLYPHCKKFISAQGGISIFNSYFSGINIIFAKKCSELRVGSYNNWYNKFSGAKIIVIGNEDKLIKTIKENY